MVYGQKNLGKRNRGREREREKFIEGIKRQGGWKRYGERQKFGKTRGVRDRRQEGIRRQRDRETDKRR